MKFYSEKLNKFFDLEADLHQAESKYKEEQLQLEKKKKEKEREEKLQAALVSKEKKEMSKAIDDADKKVTEAYEHYEQVKAEVKKILDESNKKCEELLTPAKEAIKEANQEKLNAISAFNKKYGAYTTTYSGSRAWDEFKRASTFFDDLFDWI